MKIFNIKYLIWFLIFLGLGTFFLYLTIRTKHQIDHIEHSDFEIELYKILLWTWFFFDLGFFISSIWNLYRFIKSIFKKEEIK